MRNRWNTNSRTSTWLREVPLVLLLLPQGIEPGREIVRAVEIPADAEGLAGHGPATSLELVPGAAGKLHVWAPTTSFRPFLRLEDERGSALFESRSDWHTSCCVLHVQAGDRLILRVASEAPEQSGAVELHLFLTHETEQSRLLVAEVAAELDALEGSTGDHGEATRARIDGLVQRLLEEPGADESLEVSSVLWKAASVANSHQHPAAEVRALEAVLAFRRRAFPADHPAITAPHAAMAHAQRRLGHLALARELQERVLAARERDHPGDHWLVADARQKLTDTLLDLGEIEAAHVLALGVYEGLSRELDVRAEPLQAARVNLSQSLRRIGRLHESRALSEAALDTYLELHPADHPDVQMARLNLGLVLQDLGDIDAARELLWRLHEIWKETQPGDAVGLLKSGMALAGVLEDREATWALKEELLATYSGILPSDFPDILLLRASMAERALALGEFETARALFEKVLSVLPENAPAFHDYRGRLAHLCAGLGETAAAQELFEQALTGMTRLVPEDHFQRLRLIKHYSYFLMRSGETERAAERAQEMAVLLSRSARIASISLPPRRAEAWATTAEIAIGDLLTHTLPGRPLEDFNVLAAETFELIESVRGLAFVGARVLAAADADEELGRLRGALRDAGAEVVALAGQPGLPEFVRRKEAVQAALLEHLSGGPAGALIAEPTVANLAAALPSEAAAVGFWIYRRGERDAPSEPWLLAHVVRPGRALVRVELAPEVRVREGVAEWRRAIGVSSDARGRSPRTAAPVGDEHAAGAALRALVLDPLNEAIGEATTLVVALAGPLHAVPLDALPDGEQGVVGDRLQVEVRSSLSELLIPAPEPRGGVLVALGGIDYDGEGAAAPSGSRLDGAPLAVVRGGKESFEALPGAREEALGVAALYREAFGDESPARVLSGREASKQQLASRASGARFLHLATHGFAAPEASIGRRGRAASGTGQPELERVLAFSPMVLCGLALAGANRPPDELSRVRGVITAEELAALDLSGCELAVLSACDTNVGLLKNGQGVASLQKALHLAGAHSAVTSLWRVPDEPTRELMLLFYRKLWIEGLSRARALREAKEGLRRARTPEGGPKYATRDWAGWVLTGASD